VSEFKHSSETNEHYTPPEIVEAARTVMGAIDLDPFSCAKANEVVKAEEYFDRNGFEREWLRFMQTGPNEGDTRFPSRVFCNPPGGKLSRKDLSAVSGGPGLSSSAVAWAKLVHEYELGHVEQAVFICFNLELLRTSQLFEGVRHVLEFPICVPRKRLRFWGESTPIGKGQPQHPNAIVFLPNRDDGDSIVRFTREFAQFGAVR
jgi:hypothetical protein